MTRPFRVTVQPGAASFEVQPEESVLDAALRQGVPLAHECTFGGCGTCRVALLEGQVRYDEWPLALSDGEAAAGFALMCQARACSDLVIDAEPRPAGAAEPVHTRAVVRAVTPVTDSVIHLELELPDLPALQYVPGQHLNILLGDGVHRSFSMASAPAGHRVDLHVRRIPGGHFTDGVLPQLQPGAVLEVELPLGRFHCRTQDYRPLLMVATGTGIAPIKSMLEALLDDPDCPPVWLYWGMRDERDLYLDELLRSWQGRLYEFSYVPVLSRAGSGWTGRRGHVQQAVLEDLPDLSEHGIYLCGSPAMIAEAKQAFVQHGADPRHLHADGFSFQQADHTSVAIA
ncbi:2Fe-2S iron-sulfur cluster-binding protein [Aquabacterium sp.]|uniref:2Fe-2S iron-sulfur cluster-binding protein n=1 Tax=Aquabacterium sp. TaxID=1872578 RepID=UPI00378345D2